MKVNGRRTFNSYSCPVREVKDLNNFGLSVLEVIADALEDLNVYQLSIVKMKKFSEIQTDARLEELALHLIMQNIPRSTQMTNFILDFLVDAIVVSIDGEVAIVMKQACGTEFGNTL